METAIRFAQACMWLSGLITASALVNERGGGQYMFTLMALVLLGAVLPYYAALGAARRLSGRWGTAIASAACAFGALDVLVRMQAFYFPTDRSAGGMALWLPLSSLLVLPILSVLFYQALSSREATNTGLEQASK